MVGRKLRDGELIDGQEQHMLQNEIYHESAENYDEGIQKNEGIFKYYVRHMYAVVALVLGMGFAFKAYTMSFELMLHLEDGLDDLLF